MKDQMTPMERAVALAKGLPVDRLPCNPNVANGVARVYGCKISEFAHDAKTLAKAQIASYRHYGYDSVRIFTDLFPWAEAMGATVKYPDDETADLDQPAISTIEQIDTLRPADPYKDGRLPMQLDAMKYLVDEVGTEIGGSCGVVGAFTNAFFLMGVNKVLEMTYKNPEALHKLCRVSLETVKAYAGAAIDAGVTPAISEPMSSCTVVSPRAFREFSMPYLRELVEFINSKGKKPVIHICGQTSKIWEDLVTMDIGALSIDNVASLVECKKKVGDRVKILGNVDPGVVMYTGTPLEVRRATLQCLLDGHDSPKGYMVMSGCSLPVDTPKENIHAMMDTMRDVGGTVDAGRLMDMIAECDRKMAK